MAEVAVDPEVPNIRAKRFALLTGPHTCYKCGKPTRVSAIGLADHEELGEEGYESVEDCALFTQLGSLNAEAANQVETRAPWLRFGHSMTADATYLANHCEHCKGSTPKSRTVVKGLRTSGLAWRPFVASWGCGIARCIRTHLPLQHRVSDIACDRRARA